jgi:hypothetical protein
MATHTIDSVIEDLKFDEVKVPTEVIAAQAGTFGKQPFHRSLAGYFIRDSFFSDNLDQLVEGFTKASETPGVLSGLRNSVKLNFSRLIKKGETVPSVGKETFAYAKLKREVSHLFGIVGLGNPTSDDLRYMWLLQKDHSASIGYMFRYVVSGGSTSDMNKVRNLFGRGSSREKLVNSKLYVPNGFTGFNELVDIFYDAKIKRSEWSSMTGTLDLLTPRKGKKKYTCPLPLSEAFPRLIELSSIVAGDEKRDPRDFTTLAMELSDQGVEWESIEPTLSRVAARVEEDSELPTTLLKLITEPWMKKTKSAEEAVEYLLSQDAETIKSFGQISNWVNQSKLSSYNGIERYFITPEIMVKTLKKEKTLSDEEREDRRLTRIALAGISSSSLRTFYLHASTNNKLFDLNGIFEDSDEPRRLEDIAKLQAKNKIHNAYDFHSSVEQDAFLRTLGIMVANTHAVPIYKLEEKIAAWSRSHSTGDGTRTYLNHHKYRNLRDTIYGAISTLSDESVFLVGLEEGQPLHRFFDIANKRYKKLKVNHSELVGDYFTRAKTIVAGSESPQESINAWLNNLEKVEDKDFRHVLTKGDLSDLVSSKSLQLNEVSTHLTKVSGFYSGSNYSIRPSNEEFPIPEPRIISLPETVNVGTPEDNKLVYKTRALLQAAFTRFGYFKSALQAVDLEEGSVVNALDHHGVYGNAFFAYTLWGVMHYARAKHQMKENSRISREVDAALESIKPSKDSSLWTRYKTNGGPNKIIYALRHQLLHGEAIDDFVNDTLMPKLNPLFSGDNETAFNLVEEIYDLIDNEYNIPRPTEEQRREHQDVTETIVSKKVQLAGPVVGTSPTFEYVETGSAQKARVVVNKAASISNDIVEELRHENHPQIKRIRKFFEEIKPNKVTIQRRVYEGEFNEAALHEFLIERATGGQPDTNIFNQRRYDNRSVALLVSLNQASSLGNWLDEDHRMVDHILPALVLFYEAQKMIGDPLSIAGHSSRGQDHVTYTVFKDFEDYDMADLDNKIGLMGPLHGTRSGAVYRHIAATFGQRSERRKLHLDIVVDLAKDKHYSGGTALEDVKQGVRTMHAAGIDTFALCVNPEIPTEHLSQVYGQGHFAKISHLDKLGTTMLDLYRRMTLS